MQRFWCMMQKVMILLMYYASNNILLLYIAVFLIFCKPTLVYFWVLISQWTSFLCFKFELEMVDWLIDWMEFYAVSAIFQPCNGGSLKWSELNHASPCYILTIQHSINLLRKTKELLSSFRKTKELLSSLT